MDMKTKQKNFIRRTIEAHMLYPLKLVEAMALLREPTLREAYYYAENTNYFERRGILLADDTGNVEKSFAKWLAIQKHDVQAVNSLHEWKRSVELQRWELAEDIYELENVTAESLLREVIDSVLKRKKAEDWELSLLSYELDSAIDKVKAAKRLREQAA